MVIPVALIGTVETWQAVVWNAVRFATLVVPDWKKLLGGMQL